MRRRRAHRIALETEKRIADTGNIRIRHRLDIHIIRFLQRLINLAEQIPGASISK